MKVDINHGESKEGFVIKKTWFRSTFTIAFNEEELNIIRENGLEDYVWIDIPHDDYVYEKKMSHILDTEMTVSRIMPDKKGKPGSVSGAFLTKGKIKQFDGLVQETLPKLKEFLTSYGAAEIEDQSFEL